MIATAGTWDRHEGHCYFIASDIGALVYGSESHDHLLIPVNDMTDEDADVVRGWCKAGKRVLVDSGIFILAAAHARQHDIPLPQALAMPPDQMDGYDALFTRYVALLRELGDQVWGYVELDLGGRENKLNTRAKLEALGLRPIPVYHPMSDPWDYFDELAQGYDRVCVGNLVQAEQGVRLRLIATICERARKYPGLWVHLLGVSPSAWLTAFPINSCDSSSWLRWVRWSSAHRTDVALQAFSTIPRNYTYDLNADSLGPKGHKKAWRLCGYEARMLHNNWQGIVDDGVNP